MPGRAPHCYSLVLSIDGVGDVPTRFTTLGSARCASAPCRLGEPWSALVSVRTLARRSGPLCRAVRHRPATWPPRPAPAERADSPMAYHTSVWRCRGRRLFEDAVPPDAACLAGQDGGVDGWKP